jgi:hypothetical protein
MKRTPNIPNIAQNDQRRMLHAKSTSGRARESARGMGQNTWLGRAHVAWERTHGLGENTWLGRAHVTWESAERYGTNNQALPRLAAAHALAHLHPQPQQQPQQQPQPQAAAAAASSSRSSSSFRIGPHANTRVGTFQRDSFRRLGRSFGWLGRSVGWLGRIDRACACTQHEPNRKRAAGSIYRPDTPTCTSW